MTQDLNQPLRLNYVILLLLDNTAQPPTYWELEKRLEVRRWMVAEQTLSLIDTLEWLLHVGYVEGKLPEHADDPGGPLTLTGKGTTELYHPGKLFLTHTSEPHQTKHLSLKRLVLERLAVEGPMGALQLARSISISTHERIRPAAGSLYPPLHRLRKDNLIASANRRLPQGSTYTFYSLTDAGFDALSEPEKPWHHPLSRHFRRML